MPVTRRSDLILAVSTILAYILFAVLTDGDRALVYSIVLGAFVAIIQTKWARRRDPRFWIVIAVLAIVHIVALSFVRIPEFRFGMAAAPIALVDGFAMWGLINWMERRFPAAGNASAGE